MDKITKIDISQKLILDHKSEIFGISTIEWNTTSWMRTTSLHDRAIARVYSILCFVLERFMNIPSRYGTGKTKLDGSWILVTVVN